jgi:hypothetical protein
MGIETFVNQYVNLYNPVKKTERFENGESKTEEKSNVIFILWIFLIIFAVYLSWKCNKGKLELIHFLFALMCAPIYILYQFASNGLECVTT